jgi:peptidoglycan/xylan/chitin deacetylase (PgdA/CDA1 family)
MLNEMKRAALHLMHQSGFAKAVGASRWRDRHLLILGYHGVSQEDEHLWDPTLYVSPGQFRDQLALIKAQGFRVLPLSEALSRLSEGRLPGRAVCLTFDDGTVDFYRTAHPILREFEFPATVYLTTYYCLLNAPVFPPALAYILWKGRGRTAAPYPKALGGGEPMDLSTKEGRDLARRRIWSFAEKHDLSGREKDTLLAEVASAVGYDFDMMRTRRVHHLMNPEEVSEVARAGIEVQMHTHRHRRPLDPTLYRREIVENRAIIAGLTGQTPEHFCYPSGRTHPNFLGWLAREGVRSATTGQPGLAGRKSHPLLLPRLICDSRLRPAELSAWLSGAAALLPQRPWVTRHWEPAVPAARREARREAC